MQLESHTVYSDFPVLHRMKKLNTLAYVANISLAIMLCVHAS